MPSPFHRRERWMRHFASFDTGRDSTFAENILSLSLSLNVFFYGK